MINQIQFLLSRIVTKRFVRAEFRDDKSNQDQYYQIIIPVTWWKFNVDESIHNRVNGTFSAISNPLLGIDLRIFSFLNKTNIWMCLDFFYIFQTKCPLYHDDCICPSFPLFFVYKYSLQHNQNLNLNKIGEKLML